MKPVLLVAAPVLLLGGGIPAALLALLIEAGFRAGERMLVPEDLRAAAQR